MIFIVQNMENISIWHINLKDFEYIQQIYKNELNFLLIIHYFIRKNSFKFASLYVSLDYSNRCWGARNVVKRRQVLTIMTTDWVLNSSKCCLKPIEFSVDGGGPHFCVNCKWHIFSRPRLGIELNAYCVFFN